MHKHALAGLELGIVEQHVLHCRESDGSAGGVAGRDSIRYRDDEPGRQIDEIAREAIDMKSHDASHRLAEIIASFPAGLARAAGYCPVHDDAVARLESRSG